jgi:hypothetical protein
MRLKIMPVSAMVLCLAAAVTMLALRGGAEGDDASVSSGPIKMLTLPLEGPNAGKVYFEISPDEAGAPSAFKIDAASIAAVALLTAARSSQSKIRVTYKSDFTVTELEFLAPPVVTRSRRRST